MKWLSNEDEDSSQDEQSLSPTALDFFTQHKTDEKPSIPPPTESAQPATETEDPVAIIELVQPSELPAKKLPSPKEPETASVPSDTDFKSTSEALIKKLLQLSSPRLDIKIVSVLQLEGMMDLFMSHITRLNPNKPKINLETLTLLEKVDLAAHERDLEDLKATKRSYHAMELLCGNSANHFWVQDSRFQVIVSNLLDVFLSNSDGNLNHFGNIFQHFVRRHPCSMLDFVIIKKQSSRFFDLLLPYITQGPVVDSILSLLFVRDIDSETEKKRGKAHQKLQEMGFLEWLLDAIQVKDHPQFAEAAQELLLRVIEETSHVDNGGALLKSLQSEGGPVIIDTLVKLIMGQKPSKERSMNINVLKLLVKSGTLTTRASTLSQPVQGPLYAISVRTQKLLAKHMSELCSVVVSDRNSLSTKMHPLTTSDLELLQVIHLTLMHAEDTTQLLEAMTPAFWKILVNSSSNIYHTFFFRLFYLVLNIGHEPTLLLIIRKQKLLTRLVDVYTDKNHQTDNRGFILLILNYLRLMADVNHSSLIHRIVTSHPRFQDFLPTLRAETLVQTQANADWKLDSCPRPPPHIGPSPPIRSAPFSPYSATLPLMGGPGDHDETWSCGIDLGSDFAYCLGFDQDVKPDGAETPAGHLSRRGSVHSSSGESAQSEDSRPPSPNDYHHDVIPGFVFESLTPEEAPTTKKKKKKKKEERE
ncbi:hypothetical protein CLU79DRAFT_835119 [Phycomyces nitens]|nr:hypothetical protein CLU79DRAFT_835119 [Phycomyces nitens]